MVGADAPAGDVVLVVVVEEEAVLEEDGEEGRMVLLLRLIWLLMRISLPYLLPPSHQTLKTKHPMGHL